MFPDRLLDRGFSLDTNHKTKSSMNGVPGQVRDILIFRIHHKKNSVFPWTPAAIANFADTKRGAGFQRKMNEPYKGWPNDAGFNASVETRKPIELVIKGKIPAAVAGTLYRTGPGHYKVADTPLGEYKTTHWFDGFTVIHRFQLISDGQGSCKAVYNSRKQVDELLESIRKTGRLESISFGQKRDPCTSFFQKLKCVFEPVRAEDPYKSNVGVTITSNPSGLQAIRTGASTSVGVRNSNFIVVKTDTSQMKTVDMETLEPIGVTDQRRLHPDLNGPLSCAHAQYDPENGDVFNYNLAFGISSTYRIFKTSLSSGQTEILATISGLPGAYIHSFFLTKDFVILCVWSSHFVAGGIKLLWERNVIDTIGSFDPNSQSKWLVVDRRHGKGLVATFESSAMFSFHSVNAWQEPRQGSGEVDIVCDIIQYPTLDVLKKLYYENLTSTGSGVPEWKGLASRPSSTPSLVRYHLPKVPLPSKDADTSATKTIAKAEMQFAVSAPLVGDLPTINPQYSTKRSRYVYSLVDQGYSSWVDGISKFDTVTKTVVIWTRAKHTPGEAIFVPDPDRVGEDAGFLLSVVLDGLKGTSYLLCLDAETMEEVGSAQCDVAVGFGFHGNHVSS